MTKRKAEDQLLHPPPKKLPWRAIRPSSFAKGCSTRALWTPTKPDTPNRPRKLQNFPSIVRRPFSHLKFSSYKHGIISDLISPALLRSVRAEVQDSVHFTPKETDIYRIHQSGDLANLDGLDDGSLRLLPSLLNLRDVLYSAKFRTYISDITGSGPLSGRKTDMAINVYTPGCHLLCHDDVIGSRRVSYILYLTDPDRPWQKEWGGALRLYPTDLRKTDSGEESKVPGPDFSASIPPAFNQLSFFAVQPGRAFMMLKKCIRRAIWKRIRRG